MTNKFVAAALFAALIFAFSRPAEAVTKFKAIIENEQVVANPPVPEQGSGGTGVFELNDTMTAFSYDITLFGIDLDGFQTPNDVDDNANSFHIHAAPAGQNGGVVFGMRDPNDDPDDQVINPVTGRITGVWDGVEGNNTTLGDQLPNLFNHWLFFCVHTRDYPGIELRGQILLVPEPTAWVLGLLGLVPLWLTGRRRKLNA
jgi:hypothetical protein